jgi:hypothetical protein
LISLGNERGSSDKFLLRQFSQKVGLLALSQKCHISCDTAYTPDENVQLSFSHFAAPLIQGEEGKVAPLLSDL